MKRIIFGLFFLTLLLGSWAHADEVVQFAFRGDAPASVKLALLEKEEGKIYSVVDGEVREEFHDVRPGDLDDLSITAQQVIRAKGNPASDVIVTMKLRSDNKALKIQEILNFAKPIVENELAMLLEKTKQPQYSEEINQRQTTVYRNEKMGIEFKYPADFKLNEDKLDGGRHRKISLYSSLEAEFPCFTISSMDKQHFQYNSKALNNWYWYEEKTNEWVPLDHDKDKMVPAKDRQKITETPFKKYIGDKIPVYVDLNNMSDVYEADIILTNKNFALLIARSYDSPKNMRYREINEDIAQSIKLIGGLKPVEAK